MNKRPLVHIGMQKCASTWLQRQFFKPRNGFQQPLDNSPIYWVFIDPRSYEWQNPREQLELENDEGLVPVLSAEALVGNPMAGGVNGETNMHRLKACLPDARILLIIREQRAMLRSLYNLLVNWGMPHSIETLLYNELAVNVPNFEARFLFYDNIIRSYQEQFGRENLLVLPMEQFQVDPATFLDTISRFCELDQTQFPINADTGRRINEKRSLVSLEIKRCYNRYIAKTKLSPGGLYRPIRIQGKCNFNPRVPAWLNERLENRFAARVEKMIAGLYADSNLKTQELTGLDLAEYGYKLPDSHKP